MCPCLSVGRSVSSAKEYHCSFKTKDMRLFYKFADGTWRFLGESELKPLSSAVVLQARGQRRELLILVCTGLLAEGEAGFALHECTGTGKHLSLPIQDLTCLSIRLLGPLSAGTSADAIWLYEQESP
jgi:hypothetical protein